jgi:hypothetical protein
MNMLRWESVCGDGTGTLLKLDRKYLEIFEMWCWCRMEQISWTNRGKK